MGGGGRFGCQTEGSSVAAASASRLASAACDPAATALLDGGKSSYDVNNDYDNIVGDDGDDGSKYNNKA